MIKRNIRSSFLEILTKYPVLVMTGPRQSGKTTMLKQTLPGYRYVSLEDPDNRAFATNDPRGFLAEYDSKVIFDEVQQTPHIFSYIQSIVDQKNEMGQFILSGSQNFNLMANITQSLAGRASIFKLFPFDFVEMKNSNLLSTNLGEVMTNGFYPAIHNRKINPDRYYSDYMDTYVNRDVSQLINIQDNRAFRTFIKLCAARAGQLVNFNDLARGVGVSHTTVRKWMSILETSYVLFTLKPYFKNYSKRVVKRPKLYFYDTGLLCHLLDIRKGNFTPSHSLWGNVFENMIVSEFEKQNYHFSQLRDYWFWRDSHGNEIDLLYPSGEKLHLFEIKSSTTISEKMFKGLNKFSEVIGKNTGNRNIVYGGIKDQKRTNFHIKSWFNVQPETVTNE